MVNKKKDTTKKSMYLNKISSLIKRKEMKVIVPVIFILFAMFFAFSVRSGPISLDSLDQRVEQGVYSQIENALSAQIDQDYPNINPQFKQELLQKGIQKVRDTGEVNLGGQSIQVDTLIKSQAENAKELFQADNGQTYLTAIDPYFFLRKASNLAELGTQGDILIDGVGYENKQLAPDFVKANAPNFHIWLEAKLLNFAGVDKPSSIGERTKPVFMLSLLIAVLSIIPIFYILRAYTSNLTALFGALILASLGTFVSRTIAGFVDTDAYQVLFPLTIVAFMVAALKNNKLNFSIILSVIAGLFLGLFIWAWFEGWFIFIFSLLALVGYIAYLFIESILDKKNKIVTEEFKKVMLSSITFIISSFIFVWTLASQNILTISFNGVFKNLAGDIASISSNIWPNVLSSVAELAKASFPSIVNSVGGQNIFFIAMFGLLALSLDVVLKNKEDTSKNMKKWILGISIVWFFAIVYQGLFLSLTANAKLLFLVLLFLPIGLSILHSLWFGKSTSKMFMVFLLSIWMIGTIYMSFNGVRFILLLAPAFSIAFGFGMFYIAKYINSFIKNEFKSSKKEDSHSKGIFGYVVIGILFLVLFQPIATQAKAIGDGALPNFDDNWYNAMYEIKNSTSEDAIITSWWDFGHFFATVGDRGVTFDGASQTTPQAHWVGKLLLESDEKVSKDILKMLVCGGNKAFDTFESFTKDQDSDAVKINKVLYSTFGKSQQETKNLLSNNKYYDLSEGQVNEIMTYLSCSNPRESLLITSGDMVGKAAVWAHWGSWDFTKKYVFNNYKTLSPEIMAENIDENVSLIKTYVEDLQKIDVTSETQDKNKEQLQNQWFAPYPSYAGNFACQLQNATIVCPQSGLQFDMQTGKVLHAENLQVKIRKVIIPTSIGFVQEFPQDENGLVDIVLLGSQQGFTGMLMQAPLGDSLFSKLFYMEGTGTSFEKFYDTQTQTAGRVIVWKTNWNESNSSSTPNLSDLTVESIDSN